MPEYRFINEQTGEAAYRIYHAGTAPNSVKIKGRTFHRDFCSTGARAEGGKSCWPMTSVNGGINPEQIPEFQKMLRKKGVPTEFTPSGDVIHPTRGHRKRFHEAMGLVDKAGGYGDATETKSIGD